MCDQTDTQKAQKLLSDLFRLHNNTGILVLFSTDKEQDKKKMWLIPVSPNGQVFARKGNTNVMGSGLEQRNLSKVVLCIYHLGGSAE